MNPELNWREPPDPLHVLVACRWLTPSLARDPHLVVYTTSSSHTVVRVDTPDGRAAVVKLVPREAATSGRSLVRELYVYRMASWNAELATALPRPIFMDERRQLLVIEGLTPSIPRGVLQNPAADTGRQLGQLMARWHRSTRSLPFWPSPAHGVLLLPDMLEAACKGRPTTTRHLMNSIVSDENLSRALRESGAVWSDTCLIHGDIRRDNWAFSVTSGRPRLKVLDWELSGYGDPAWDIASVFAEASLDIVHDGADVSDDQWITRIGAATAEFVRAYSQQGVVALREEAAARKVALFAISRLLHISLEWADTETDSRGSSAQRIVAQARLFQERGDEIAAGLLSAARR